MGRKLKAGVKGAAHTYISRNQALKKLQVSLPDFRRLCILKGIYPRVPTNFRHLNKTSTYYYRKDIQFLAHEPLLHKFREFKAFSKKISKALGKGDKDTAERLDEAKPTYTVDHLVKERYPTFIDAIRDLDDGLCMIFLFRIMPRSSKVRREFVTTCDQLAREFLNYVVATNALRKCFLSIKGIYYQAEIMGQTVTWVAPFNFSQKIPSDVDFRVMLNFLEFYSTALGFVNCRLYNALGLKYPPDVNAKMDNKAISLRAFKLEAEQVDEVESKINDNEEEEQEEENNKVEMELEEQEGDEKTVEEQLKTSAARAKSIRSALDSITKNTNDNNEESNDTNNNDNDDNANIIDEFVPQAQGSDDLHLDNKINSSQAVFANLFKDCKFFISREVPAESLEFVIRACGGEISWAGLTYDENDQAITHQIVDRPLKKNAKSSRYYVQPQWIYDCINAKKLVDVEDYLEGKALPPHLSPFIEAGDEDYDPTKPLEGEEEGEEDDVEDEEDEHQKELEAERKGISFSTNENADTNNNEEEKAKKKSKKKTKVKRSAEEIEEEESKDLAKIMMSRKHQRLYNTIMHGKDKKAAEVQKLVEKRKQLNKKTKVEK